VIVPCSTTTQPDGAEIEVLEACPLRGGNAVSISVRYRREGVAMRASANTGDDHGSMALVGRTFSQEAC